MLSMTMGKPEKSNLMVETALQVILIIKLGRFKYKIYSLHSL